MNIEYLFYVCIRNFIVKPKNYITRIFNQFNGVFNVLTIQGIYISIEISSRRDRNLSESQIPNHESFILYVYSIYLCTYVYTFFWL